MISLAFSLRPLSTAQCYVLRLKTSVELVEIPDLRKLKNSIIVHSSNANGIKDTGLFISSVFAGL